MKAQVTIGHSEAPEKHATLQIKDQTAPSTGGVTAKNGGLLLPRVELENKYQLLPFYQGDTTNTDYKTVTKPAHTGLIVYNLKENDDDELCLGFNQWDGGQWNCFQEKMGNAKFAPVDCSDITVNGVYVEGMTTTSANYLSINLNVTKAGAFAITATSNNGYNFYLSGVALNVGSMTVNIPCQGTPVDVQTDKLTFSGIELSQGCEPEVQVSSAVSSYSLNCSSVVVNGQYVKGQNLTSANTITLNVNVSETGSYSILVEKTNGVRFSATGDFTSTGSHSITLVGSGSPTVNNDFPVTIISNTKDGNATCNATIPVTLPFMTYAIVGNSGTYSWATAERKKALDNGDSFGPNGIVKTLGLSQLWSTGSVSTATDQINNGYNGKFPDVILYFAYSTAPNNALTTALANYINKGGTVIYGSADGTSSDVNILLNGIFGIQTAQAQASGNDDIYLISNFPEDPVINGPFGNLCSKYWGEDNGSTGSVIMTQLPPNSVQVCTARGVENSKREVDPTYSIVWYNDSKSFFFIGDSTGSSSSNTTNNAYPSYYTNTGLPNSKLYGPSSTETQFVYNAALELNAVSWALKKAAVSGINPH